MRDAACCEKELLRARMTRRCVGIPPRVRDGQSARITKQIRDLPAFAAPDAVLLCYASKAFEVSTWDLLRFAWTAGKRVALPRCRKGGIMDFYLVCGERKLRASMFGIMEPDKTCTRYVPQPGDLCVVPGLAFDSEGYRLGKGGGYYDRYLARYPVMQTVGVCFSDCMVQTLPRESFDIPVQQVIC